MMGKVREEAVVGRKGWRLVSLLPRIADLIGEKTTSVIGQKAVVFPSVLSCTAKNRIV